MLVPVLLRTARRTPASKNLLKELRRSAAHAQALKLNSDPAAGRRLPVPVPLVPLVVMAVSVVVVSVEVVVFELDVSDVADV